MGRHSLKKVLFRADAKPSIGIGDLMSLIHLSEYFTASGWQTHFMIRGYEAGVSLSKTYELKRLHILSPYATIEEEVESINHYCRLNQIDLLFFEITERRLTEYSGLLNSVKKACVCFDGYISHDFNLVVDWDVESKKFFTPLDFKKTKFLLGPEFVILPIEFYLDSRISNRNHKLPAKTVLIAMGGADESNFTRILSEIISKKRPDLFLNIIVGSGYEYKDSLFESLSILSTNFSIKHNISNMIEEYISADIAIGAGGLTASELVASKTPCMLMATYKHQIARCQYFDTHGYAFYLGHCVFKEDDLFYYLENPPIPNQTPKFDTHRIVRECNEI